MVNLAFEDLLNVSEFHERHIGIDAQAETAMLAMLGVASRDELARQAMPAAIFHGEPLPLPAPATARSARRVRRGSRR